MLGIAPFARTARVSSRRSRWKSFAWIRESVLFASAFEFGYGAVAAKFSAL